MSVRILSSADDLKRYDTWVRSHEHGSLWQSEEQAHYQRALERETRIYGVESGKWKVENNEDAFLATALVTIDRTTGGFSTWDIARGPLGSGKWTEELLVRIIEDARKDKCLALYLSPLAEFSTFHFPLSVSPRRIHAEATRIVDLTTTEEQILAQMHQKGRYNIGVATKAGVTVRKGSIGDIDAFYALLVGTGGRDGFTISQKSHYTRFLSDLEGSFLLLAEHEGRPIAGLIGVIWKDTGIYYYGASSYNDRQYMAPYILQWEAMKVCKEAGCTRYDLLGIEAPSENSKLQQKNPKRFFGILNLEFGFSRSVGSWAGITDFKRKFGGTVLTYPPEQMIVLKPIIKAILDMKRRFVG